MALLASEPLLFPLRSPSSTAVSRASSASTEGNSAASGLRKGGRRPQARIRGPCGNSWGRPPPHVGCALPGVDTAGLEAPDGHGMDIGAHVVDDSRQIAGRGANPHHGGHGVKGLEPVHAAHGVQARQDAGGPFLRGRSPDRSCRRPAARAARKRRVPPWKAAARSPGLSPRPNPLPGSTARREGFVRPPRWVPPGCPPVPGGARHCRRPRSGWHPRQGTDPANRPSPSPWQAIRIPAHAQRDEVRRAIGGGGRRGGGRVRARVRAGGIRLREADAGTRTGGSRAQAGACPGFDTALAPHHRSPGDLAASIS